MYHRSLRNDWEECGRWAWMIWDNNLISKDIYGWKTLKWTKYVMFICLLAFIDDNFYLTFISHPGLLGITVHSFIIIPCCE